jgi:hypothetical protein
MMDRHMSPLRLALIIAAYAAGLPSVAAAQDHWLRDRVRENGDLALSPLISCGPPVGLKEIVEYTQLTVEGVVSRADSALTPEEDSLYTDYVIDVTRVFRIAPAMVSRATPGATEASPFVANAPVSRAGASDLSGDAPLPSSPSRASSPTRLSPRSRRM